MGTGQASGYIVVPRDDDLLWSLRPTQFKIALTCLRLANWRDSEWFDGRTLITLRRGEFVTSQANLARASGPGVTTKMVRGSIEILGRVGWLDVVAGRASAYTRIRVINFDTYAPSNKKKGEQRASEGRVKGEQRATGEEVTRSSVISLAGDHMFEQNSELEGGDKVQLGRPRLEPTAEALTLADFLRSELLEAQPGHRIGRREWGDDDGQRRKWAIELDRMVRGDGRDWRRSAEHVRWVFRGQTGDAQFVVESPGALRKKWDAIERTRRGRRNGEQGLSAVQLAEMAITESRNESSESARADVSPKGLLPADGDLGDDGQGVWDRLVRSRS